MSIPNMEAVALMRDLPLDARNAAIGAATNVVDLRPTLAAAIAQRMLARQYKSARKPEGRA